jgi:hypothetical protein
LTLAALLACPSQVALASCGGRVADAIGGLTHSRALATVDRHGLDRGSPWPHDPSQALHDNDAGPVVEADEFGTPDISTLADSTPALFELERTGPGFALREPAAPGAPTSRFGPLRC